MRRRRWRRAVTGVVTAALLAGACSSTNDATPSTTNGRNTNPAAGGSGSSVPSANRPAYATTLEPQIRQLMKDNAIPGAVVLIRSRSQGDWSQAFGTRTVGKDEPLTLDDHFRVGSNTKTMTGTIILQLAQEGKVSLTDPISGYQSGVPNGDDITLTQLLEMRSGLYNYSVDAGFNQTLDDEPQKAWTPDELLAIAFAHAPNFAPGKGFEYSNTNTVLLGIVIESVTGKSVTEAFQERIFGPLGLTNSLMPPATDSSIADPHPHGYMFGTNVSTLETAALPPDQRAAAVAGTLLPSDQTNDNPSWGWTAGAVISTAGDLATYVKAMVGGELLDEKTQKLRLDSIQSSDPSNPEAAGYGMAIAQFGPQLGHDGQLPGFMSFMGYDPDQDITIIVLTNLTATPSGQGSALVIAKAILPVLYPKPAGEAGTTTP